MNILIAPNAFKGTIEADEAAEIIQKAILKVKPEYKTVLCPIADGGDGTCFLLGRALGLNETKVPSLDPLGRPLEGFYFFDEENKTAYLDVSTVSGIKNLQAHERNPWISSTYGTGLLIKNALDKGAEHIVLGLGGSATVDLGLGILRGLGFLFLDEKGREIPVFSEKFLKKTKYIQSPVPKPTIHFTCLCDVNNFFFGKDGAIPVFGPQKGIKQEELEDFEITCSNLIDLLSLKTSKNVTDHASFGAAGGIAFGLSFFFPIEIKMGASWFFEKVDMVSKIAWTDLIITGEGRYDSQSAGGKGSYELLQLAKKSGKNTVLITSGEAGKSDGFSNIIQLPDLDFSEKKIKEKAIENLLDSITKYFESSF
jgi:glycerate 2-kinase